MHREDCTGLWVLLNTLVTYELSLDLDNLWNVLPGARKVTVADRMAPMESVCGTKVIFLAAIFKQNQLFHYRNYHGTSFHLSELSIITAVIISLTKTPVFAHLV